MQKRLYGCRDFKWAAWVAVCLPVYLDPTTIE
jgi:hypothetical protein